MAHIDHRNPDSTLSLPRILCLHGGGTNARIFKSQCRILEAQLRSSFRLCYAEAPFPSDAGPDVLLVYKHHGPFKRWLRWRPEHPEISSQEVVDAIQDSLQEAMFADNLRGGTGEWVGLLGFSQGAKLAASLLLEQQFQAEQSYSSFRPHIDVGIARFRFAVLIAGRAPLVALDPELERYPGLVVPSQLTMGVNRMSRENCPFPLRIPTIHVHGLRDPGLEWHRLLLEHYCARGTTRVISWDGGHRLPIKGKDVLPIVHEIIDLAGHVNVFKR